MRLQKAGLIGIAAAAILAGCNRHPARPALPPVPVIHDSQSATPYRPPVFDGRPLELRLQWSTGAAPGGAPILLTDVMASPDGALHLLGQRNRADQFYRDIRIAGPVRPQSVRQDGWMSAVVSSDDAWLVGIADRAHGLGDVTSKTLVGRMRADGREIWVRKFGSKRWDKGSFRFASGAARLPSGDLVAAGREGATAWLARISTGGELIWERKIGVDQNVAIVAIGDRIVLALLEAAGSEETGDYRQDLTVRTYSDAGALLTRTVIRPGVNHNIGAYFGRAALAHSGQDVYLLSAWADSFRGIPYELAKLDPSGRVLWRRDLPSAARVNGRWGGFVCDAAMAVMPDGGPLVACSSGSGIDLLRLSPIDGALSQSHISPPPCHTPSGLVFPFVSADGRVTLVGGPPYTLAAEDLKGRDCTWLGDVANAEPAD